MAAGTVSNLQAEGLARSESKSARKKKAKAEAAASGTANVTSASTPEATGDKSAESDAKANGASSSEHPYLRELQKNIRNINKKLNATQKVDSIIAENPNVSLDELVNTRKINNDQKAQALKKPGLQAQLVELEERINQFKKFAQEFQDKYEAEKSELLSAHEAKVKKTREEARTEVTKETAKATRTRLLTLSRFLRAAAARRQLEEDDSDVAKAFEGALLLIYGGDVNAVDAAEKLIDGSDEAVPSTDGAILSVTYKEVKETALNEVPVAEEDLIVESAVSASYQDASTTDPTIANAGMTELSGTNQALNGNGDADVTVAPPTGATGDEAANATAEAQWDTKPPGQDTMSASAESFEIVPRDLAETETGAAPMPTTSTQSWADEVTTEKAATGTETPTSTGNSNDGFHEVHHGRGGKPRGNFQGERGGHRGRGPRGDGRGRGGFRGDRGRGRGSYRGRGRGDSQ